MLVIDVKGQCEADANVQKGPLDQCIVCEKELREAHKYKLKCGHNLFHRHCIAKLNKQATVKAPLQCPTCKEKIQFSTLIGEYHTDKKGKTFNSISENRHVVPERALKLYMCQLCDRQTQWQDLHNDTSQCFECGVTRTNKKQICPNCSMYKYVFLKNGSPQCKDCFNEKPATPKGKTDYHF